MRVVLTGFQMNSINSSRKKINNDDLEDLAKLLDEIESWQKENKCVELNRGEKLNKERVVTIELPCDEYGQVNEEYFQQIVRNCQDEFIKVRMPNNIIANCVLKLILENDSPECRRRERPKTIAEYLV